MRVRRLTTFLLVLAAVTATIANQSASASPETADLAPRQLRVTTTIQAAVDSASPGDTVFVPRGVHHETVLVTTSPRCARDGRIEHNVARSNNLPNPFAPVCNAPDDPPGCEPFTRLPGRDRDGLRVQLR